jgi:hypothetical protein
MLAGQAGLLPDQLAEPRVCADEAERQAARQNGAALEAPGIHTNQCFLACLTQAQPDVLCCDETAG